MFSWMENVGIVASWLVCTFQKSTALATAPAIRWFPMCCLCCFLHTQDCSHHVCAEHAHLVLLHTHLVLTLLVRHSVTCDSEITDWLIALHVCVACRLACVAYGSLLVSSILQSQLRRCRDQSQACLPCREVDKFKGKTLCK